MVFVPELGGDDPPAAVPFNGLADERFGEMVAVAFGSVDQVEPQLAAPSEHAIDLVLGEVLAPFAAKLPGADADDGDFEVGFAEPAVFHGFYSSDTGSTSTAILSLLARSPLSLTAARIRCNGPAAGLVMTIWLR